MNKLISQKKLNPALFTLIMCGIVLLAFGMRVAGLGASALTDLEARNAIDALTLTNARSSIANSQPLFLNITSINLWLAGLSNFGVRIFPAIIGSLFCLVPALGKEKLGGATTIFLGLLFAVEPSLVAASRQADSTILAVVFSTTALVFFWKGSHNLAGIFLGLALLSGPRAWLIMVGFGLTWAIFKILFFSQKVFLRNDQNNSQDQGIKDIRSNIISTAVFSTSAVILFGTLFFTRFGQINGAAGGLLEFLKGWESSTSLEAISFKAYLLTLLSTSLFTVFLAIISFVNGMIKRDRASIFLGIYFFSLMILTSLWPARRPCDIACIVVPAALLVAWYVKQSFLGIKENLKVVVITVALQFSLIIFAYLNLLWIVRNYFYATADLTLHTVAAIAAVVLVIVISFLETWGWSWKVARSGILLTFVILSGLVVLSQAGRASGFPGKDTVNPFVLSEVVGKKLLEESIEQIARMNARNSTAIDIAIEGNVSDSLRWALAQYSTTYYPSGIPALKTPSIILSFSARTPELASDYRGQDFTWSQTINMENASIMDWVSWSMLGNISSQPVPVYVWVRSDLLPIN